VVISGENIHPGTQKILISNPNAEYGIISDIDDTILHTQVTSFWKMLFYSFFKTPWQREAIQNASTWFNKMSKGGENPFFYISHSPWNIYQNIIKFLELGAFPEGPVLLRDYGFHILEKPKEYTEHKKIFITKILEMHSDLPFILIGDAAEKDAHIYYEFLTKSEESIKKIYIRKNKSMDQDLSLYENHPKFIVIEDFPESMTSEKK
jgi:phosphatidate phosphatase APP1